MALARYEGVAQDKAGNVIPFAKVEVRKDQTGRPVVPLFSDRNGTVAIGNPITANELGQFAFHVLGGVYYIRVYTGPSQAPFQQYTKRYQAVGTAAERDVEELASALESGLGMFATKTAMDLFVPGDTKVGARVLNDSDPTKNGDYLYVGSVWVKQRGLPDTLGRMTVTGGTANAITASISPGVDPANVVMLLLTPTATNTGPATLNGVNLLGFNGAPLEAGWLQANTPVLVYLDGAGKYRLALDHRFAILSDQTLLARDQAVTAMVRAETAEVNAEAARDLTLTYRNQAEDAKDAAIAASEAAGVDHWEDTKADAMAGLGGYAEGDVIGVFADESKGGAQVFYRVEGGALVEKIDVSERTQAAIDANYGAISLFNIGASGDGVTLDDNEIEDAVGEAFLRASLIVTNGGATTQRAKVVGADREYRVSRPIIAPSGGGVDFEGLRIIVDSSFEPVGSEPNYIFALGQGAVLDATDALEAKNVDITFRNCFFDGRHVSDVGGIYANHTRGLEIAGNKLYHFSGRAIDIDRKDRFVTCGNWRIGANRILEWTENEPADPVLGDGFANATLRLGTGIRINSPDGVMIGNEVGFCKFPLDVDFGGWKSKANHWYGGSIDITHPLDDTGTRFGARFFTMDDFFDNLTSLTVHNPIGVGIHGKFFSPLVGGPSTRERSFVTVAVDTSSESAFQTFTIDVDGIFRAPSATLGRVTVFHKDEVAVGAFGYAIKGMADGLFEGVRPEIWKGIFSDTVTRFDFANRVAGEQLEFRFQDGTTTRWSLTKSSANALSLVNAVSGATAWTVDATDTVIGVPKLKHTGSVLGFFNQPGVSAQPAGAGQAFIGDPSQQAMTNNSGGTASTTIDSIVAGGAYDQADMVAVKNAIASLHTRLNEVRVDVIAVTALTKAIRSALLALGLIKGSA